MGLVPKRVRMHNGASTSPPLLPPCPSFLPPSLPSSQLGICLTVTRSLCIDVLMEDGEEFNSTVINKLQGLISRIYVTMGDSHTSSLTDCLVASVGGSRSCSQRAQHWDLQRLPWSEPGSSNPQTIKTLLIPKFLLG